MSRFHLVTVSVYLLAQPLWAMDSAQLLQNMSEAMHSKNYSGTFVYRHKNKVETLKIIHRNTEQGINERVVTLSGKPREIIRDESVVTCIWPDNKMVLVDKTPHNTNRKNRFPGFVLKDLDRLPAYYDLVLAPKRSRVASRAAYVVDVKPKDRFRYGYRLWIDEEAFLLLRSDLLNESGDAVEQVLFTELQLYDTLPDEAFAPELLAADYEWRETGQATMAKSDDSVRWQTTSLPPGFQLLKHQRRHKGKELVSVEHMIFSDGIASVSVFIEQKSKGKSATRKAGRGALNVYGKQLNGHHIVVLGEVPGSTVKLIADSIELNQ